MAILLSSIFNLILLNLSVAPARNSVFQIVLQQYLNSLPWHFLLHYQKNFHIKNLLITSCLFFFLKIIAFLFADNIAEIYLAQCLQFFSYGLFIPASTYYLNSILPMQDKSKGQTLLGIFTFGLSGLISSLLSGTILDFFSVDILLALEGILSFIGIIGICITCHFLTKNSTSPS